MSTKREIKEPSYFRSIIKGFFKNKLGVVSLIIIILISLIALFAPLIANDKPLLICHNKKFYFPAFRFEPELKNYYSIEDYKSKKFDLIIYPIIPISPTQYNLKERLQPPSKKHIFGTDDRGRDVFVRMIYGARISLTVGFVAESISIVLGLFFGILAGYYGGKVDLYISRFIEIIMCFPTFFLILAVLAIWEPGIYNIMFVIGITGWTGIARLVRGEFLRVKSLDFITGAKVSGASAFRIILLHILPNALAPVFVAATFGIASAILVESSLSFLGFGVPPPTPTWGDILSQGRNYTEFAYWLIVFPGSAIFIVVTCYNIIGEVLRDLINPKNE